MFSRRALFAAALLIVGPRLAGAIPVSGTITTETWTKANSPYCVTGTIIIPASNTLTIQPGVDVLFDADVQFHVRGRLVAHGAPLDSIRFIRGSAAKWGGMRIIKADSCSFRYVRFSDSHRRDASGKWEDTSGGAVFVDSSTSITMCNTVISKNIADGYGGGICVAHTRATLTDCTIADNSAAEYGGGISNNYGTAVLTMTNCLVVGNTAVKYGGAMENWGAKTEVTHCVFYGNAATPSGGVSGGSMLMSWGTNPTLTVRNTIVWGNTPAAAIRVEAGTVDVTYCDIQGGRAGTGNINADPLFVSAVARNFRLQAGSPCINAGDPASPLDPDGSPADMGLRWTPVLYGDVSGDGTVSGLDASLVLRHVVNTSCTLAVPAAADVTGNGSVSAYDAALILIKVLQSDYRFPVERVMTKPAATASVRRILSLERVGSAWVLNADNPAGIFSGDVVLTLADETPAHVTGNSLVEYRQEGRNLNVAFARTGDGDPALFSIVASADAAPSVAHVSLNEGAIEAAFSCPLRFALDQNIPNPFNPATTICFALPEPGHAVLAVYGLDGQLVRTLVNHTLTAGEHRIVWDGKDTLGREAASGTYIAHLHTGQGALTRRMTLLR